MFESIHGRRKFDDADTEKQQVNFKEIGLNARKSIIKSM